MAKRASTHVIRSWFGISCPMAVHTYLLFLPLAILPMLSGCVEEDGLEDLSRLAPDEVAVAAVHPASMQLPLASSLGVTFSRDLAPAGYQFKGKRTFTFTSEPFRLVEARIFRERADDGERAYRVVGTFTFNYPVAPEAFERCFSLELKRRGSVEWELETRSDSENLSFRSAPIALEEKDGELAITVEKGLQPTRGDAALAESVVRTIKIPALERLVVERMRFETVNGRRQVRIELSDEVDPADLEKALLVEPEPKNLAITSRKSDACLQGTWDYAIYYCIRLSADLTSVHGFVLDHDFEGTISVGRLEPSVEISGHGSYLAIRGDRTIGVETVNVDEVTIELDRIYANNLVPFLHHQGLGTLNRGWWRGLKEYGTNVFRRGMGAL